MDLKKILPTDGPPVEEVLKYVEKYKNEIIVIKYGGNVFIDRKIFDNFIKDLSVLSKLGLQVVVVHGGGPRIKRELDKSNIESKFIRGLRVTSEKIINIVTTENVVNTSPKTENPTQQKCSDGIQKIEQASDIWYLNMHWAQLRVWTGLLKHNIFQVWNKDNRYKSIFTKLKKDDIEKLKLNLKLK